MLQPCRCLCRGLVQITRITPFRRITRQCSQSLFTDGRTFIVQITSVPEPPSPDPDPRQGLPPTRDLRPGIPEVAANRAVSLAHAGDGHLPVAPGKPYPWPRTQRHRSTQNLVEACQDLRRAPGDQNRVLKMGRWQTIFGHHRPIVRQHPDSRESRIHHRLDCQRHARLEPR